MTRDRLALPELTGRYIDGDLSEEQSKMLLALIEGSPDAKRELAHNVLCHLVLCRKYEGDRNLQEHFNEIAAAERRREQLRLENLEYEKNPFAFIDEWEARQKAKALELTPVDQPRASLWPLIISVIVLLVLLIPVELEYYRQQKRFRMESELYEPPFTGLARIKEVVDPVWPNEKSSHKRGEELVPGELNLVSGLVKLEFGNGAEVVLEGPSRFLIHSPLRTSCLAGSASVFVPQTASGFEMATPWFTVVDRGTSFYVCSQKGHAEAYTVAGQVEIADRENRASALPVGEGVRINQRGQKTTLKGVSPGYITGQLFTKRLFDFMRRETVKKEELGKAWDNDAGLLARFDFSQEQNRVVTNVSKRGQAFCSALTIENCGRGEGSISGSRATRFYDKQSCAKFTLNANCRSVTLLADVRMDRSDNFTNVLLADERFTEDAGRLLWQVSPQEGVILHISQGQGKKALSYPLSLTGRQIPYGSWTRLAVVLDAEKKMIYHYIDGVLFGQFKWREPAPIQIGACMIGNNLIDAGLNDRFLNGAVEQFCIFDRPVLGREMRNEESGLDKQILTQGEER
ncbi:MAG: LamG-like jellyroll fold domain-containing protein [Planctomycetia bacterium]|nr:LamG-like jellyroll fold domain-containing protein [Planctomycetia bacterium]